MTSQVKIRCEQTAVLNDNVSVNSFISLTKINHFILLLKDRLILVLYEGMYFVF